jgi:hypothetical protein
MAAAKRSRSRTIMLLAVSPMMGLGFILGIIWNALAVGFWKAGRVFVGGGSE